MLILKVSLSFPFFAMKPSNYNCETRPFLLEVI